ncbi:hypothetical protein G3I40_37395 [Streptomyces sp. SID14478]|uniref:hypothetical protein n=1 Tax=Streptomyces sp. SID14478 TaxID=2706073 RepID=UPI0013DFB96E|nr:hypothetical protein [Streptomyces sp. SID14478]NEB80846.1 hypothetical protein [Streptomyces sp. SID14478]
MRRSLMTPSLILSLVGLLTAAPAALADDVGTQPDVTSFGFSVSPTTVSPGGIVTLSANACEVPTVSVDAPVFDATELNEGHTATARVYDDAKPGAQYEVEFNCNGERGTTMLTIAASGIRHGVKAGIGGSSAGFDAGQLAVGAALVAGVLGASVYLLRRRATD